MEVKRGTLCRWRRRVVYLSFRRKVGRGERARAGTLIDKTCFGRFLDALPSFRRSDSRRHRDFNFNSPKLECDRLEVQYDRPPLMKYFGDAEKGRCSYCI